ncbi:MAG: TonB-dependent receptor [Alphaproteobacteria bacterium]|nr:TonB-dependent receptor [Alphaproteobacteria bacterium]
MSSSLFSQRRGALAVVAAFSAACGLAAPASADGVESVVVSAARLPEPVGQAAFSVVTLDAAALSTSDRLDNALEQVPGISLFRRTNSISANPTIQGISLRSIGPSGAGRALVLLDGVPMNDPFGGWVIWTALPSEDIARAEIVRGAGAGPYGAGALTGTISLSERGATGGIATADVSGGELGTYRAAASGGAKIGAVSLFASAATEQSNGWYAVLPGQRGAADTRLWFRGSSASLRAETALGNGMTLVERVGYYDEARASGLAGGGAKAHGLSASVTLAKAATDANFGWRLQSWLLNSDLSNVSVSVAPGRVSTTPADDQYSTPALGWGLNAAALGQAGDFHWEVGADLRDDAGESREHYFYSGGRFLDNRRSGGRMIVGGAYGELAYDTGAWLLTAGVRADEWATSQGHLVQSSIASGAVSLQSNPPSRDGLVPTGRLGVRRNFADGEYLRTAAYAGFRPPSLNELYRPFRVGNDVTNANAALNPEKLYGGEVGWGGVRGNVSWNTTAFFNQLHDAITNVTIGTSPAGGALRQRQNAGDINAVGFEGDATAQLLPNFGIHAAVALTDARVHASAAAAQLEGKRPAQAPVATITAGATWYPLAPLGLTADIRFESARFDDDLNSRRLGSALTLDLRADWTVAHDWSFYVAADNLTDARIATAVDATGVVSYDAPRMVSAGIRYAP